jgi:type I restriction enzyme S subunit
MKTVKLSDVCDISSGGTPSRNNPEFFKGDIPWAKISDIEAADNGFIYTTDECITADGLKNIRGKLFPKGTLLFAMYGSIGKVAFAGTELSANQAILGIRPKVDAQIDLKYLKCWFESNKQRLINQGQGVALKNLSATIVRNLEIELPPLNDQKRIAHLLGKVEGLIARRKHHLQQLDDLLKSVFLEMFGDPVRNEKGWDTVPFHKAGKFISGGTPSKSRDDFWTGDFPWVSPKDMKVTKIDDAIDHISEKVFEETSLKRIAPNHLLIVVRGMILAHSFPVAINVVDIAINQDMKAIKPVKGLNVVYLLNCLTSLKRQILKLISTAGHGTRKFDSVAMQKLFIPLPPIDLQNQFAAIVDKVEGLKSRYQQSLADLESLYGALSQKAFKGELDLSRVVLPDEATTEDTESTEAINHETHEKHEMEKEAFELPAPVDLGSVKSAEGRKTLIDTWLNAWLAQLGDAPFAAQAFMDAARQRLWELAEDDAPDWGAAEYDELKTQVFEALEQGRLIQGYDDANNRVQITAAKG